MIGKWSTNLGFIVLLGVLAPAMALAGGTVSGVIVDGFTGQPVRGAEVTLEGADLTLATDVAGFFRSELPAGAYVALISKEGYETQKILEVVISDNKVTDFAVVLLPAADLPAADVSAEERTENAAFSGEITIVADTATSTEAALLAERKGASGISDFLGKDEISKTTGGHAAGVLQKVTGVSIQDDKYVYVRGLGERYSNTSLNGSRIPTTEFDKKVVPLDLFPAGLLSKVEVSKTYEPDKWGDFAAGIVELSTTDFPEGSSFDLKLGAGSNSQTTGEAFGRYMGGLSFSGGGGQALPGVIPGERVVRENPWLPGDGYSPDELVVFGQSFIGEWTPEGTNQVYLASDFRPAGVAPNFSVDYGTTAGKFGVVLSASHSRGFNHRLESQQYFTMGVGDDLNLANDYDFAYDTESVRRGAIANLSYRADGGHKIQLRTLFTSDSKSESRFQEGYWDDSATDIRDYRVRYQTEQMLSFQLSGEHFFEDMGEGGLLEWKGSWGDAKNDENLRDSLYAYENNDYFLQQESQSAFLLFNDLGDTNADGGVDWTQYFTWGSGYGNLKGGAAYFQRDRDFGSRRFRYQFRDTAGIDLRLLPDDILVADNINPDTFEIREDTRLTDSYTASHTVGAVYGKADLTWGKWRLVGGLRYEDSEIDVVTFNQFDPDGEELHSTVYDKDFMPSLSMTYRLGDRSNLRAALSQTVNRPEFRELAPFEWTDVVGGRSARGNPNLSSATIRSYDMRWEWFPSDYGVIAASVFFKDFINPIERTLFFAVELQSTWVNVEGAQNLGAEIEYRRNLGHLSEKLSPLTVQFNFTWVDSEINIGEDEIATNPTRPLVGQPDFTSNLMLDWVHPTWGSSVRVLYSYMGETVVEAGAWGLPDVVSDPYGTLDFIWNQNMDFLTEGLGFKVSLTNITDEDRFQYGGFNSLYSIGRGFSLSFSYSAF